MDQKRLSEIIAQQPVKKLAIINQLLQMSLEQLNEKLENNSNNERLQSMYY